MAAGCHRVGRGQSGRHRGHGRPTPSRDLAFKVRTFDARGGLFGTHYTGYLPEWTRFAWRTTEAQVGSWPRPSCAGMTARTTAAWEPHAQLSPAARERAVPRRCKPGPNRSAISSSSLALSRSKYAATTSTSAATFQRAPGTGRQTLLILLATATAQEGTETPSRPRDRARLPRRGRTPGHAVLAAISSSPLLCGSPQLQEFRASPGSSSANVCPVDDAAGPIREVTSQPRRNGGRVLTRIGWADGLGVWQGRPVSSVARVSCPACGRH
jgi:hypothetical protein